MHRVAVVMNGRAGGLIGGSGAERLHALFGAAGVEAEIVPPESGSLTERIERARDSGADAVVVAGGDGTVACAASALAGSGTVLGLLPFGTMNLLAKDLGVPVDDLEEAVRVVAAGRVRAIDVGEVAGRDGERHVFLCAAMLGLPARLGRHREESRAHGWLGWGRFAVAAVRVMARYTSMRVRVGFDGREVMVRTPSLTITVNRLDDLSGRLFGRSALDGKRLAAYAVRRPQARHLARAALRLLRGRWRDPALLDEAVAERFTVSAGVRGLSLMLDGERMVLGPPLIFSVRPGALRVLAP